MELKSFISHAKPNIIWGALFDWRVGCKSMTYSIEINKTSLFLHVFLHPLFKKRVNANRLKAMPLVVQSRRNHSFRFFVLTCLESGQLKWCLTFCCSRTNINFNKIEVTNVEALVLSLSLCLCLSVNAFYGLVHGVLFTFLKHFVFVRSKKICELLFCLSQEIMSLLLMVGWVNRADLIRIEVVGRLEPKFGN